MAETVKDINKTNRKTYSPAVDILETTNNILLTADMPGVDEKSVEITVEKNFLTVHGMIDPTVHDTLEMSVNEYGVGDYQRVFTFNDEVDRDNIKATLKNGVLKLVLPKSERAKARKIEVISEA
ncbi:MAG: Hsp20/alpha crystallin family protein [Nitrospirae bacterium]|nr:Hsp20/alpha crystallin family protein [Nitrospirota bacterium]